MTGSDRVRRSLLLGLVFLLVGAATAGVTAVLLGAGGTGTATAAHQAPEVVETSVQETLLLVRHDGRTDAASGMTLLAAGPGAAEGTVLFLPVGTLTDIPGIGLDRLGLALQYGGPVLAQATVENLLGIEIDEVAAVDDAGLGSLLDRTGGFPVEVGERLVVRDADGAGEVRFEPGAQHLDGPRLAELWGFVARGEDELTSFARQQQVLEGLLDEAADPAVLDALVADGAPQLDTAADSGWLRGLVAALTRAREGEALQVTILPVESFGGQGPEGGSTFRPRTEAIAALVAGSLDDSVPAGRTASSVRVQVLNGVGEPGIGQLVDRRLGGGAFRIVLTDNARDFEFTETRILVYDETERSMAAAEQVRERLGVGTIAVSRQLQSVVDVTIVVGADFLEQQDGPDTDEE
jgi:polyisoprenyl-teichoic acid--peptidoglycan teichoic acid transferase